MDFHTNIGQPRQGAVRQQALVQKAEGQLHHIRPEARCKGGGIVGDIDRNADLAEDAFAFQPLQRRPKLFVRQIAGGMDQQACRP